MSIGALLWGWLACTTAAPLATPPPAPAGPPVPAVDPDAAQLATLGIPGAGEGRPVRIEHRLLFPSAESAESAALALAGQGLAVQAGSAGEAAAEEGEAWVLLAWESVELSAPRVRERREDLEILAHGFGGDYAGWEVR